MSDELSQVLSTAAQAAGVLGTTLGGPAAIAAQIAGIALNSAASFAKAGKDPLVEIQRMHSADPMLEGVREEWERLIRDKFWTDTEIPPPAPIPRESDIPAASDTESGEMDDPYED